MAEACCVDGEKTALKTELWETLTWLGNRMRKKKNVSDAHAGRHAGQGTDAMNQQLPECLVSPRGSSLGSLETLGVAHPTKTKKNVKWLPVRVINIKQQKKLVVILHVAFDYEN